MIGRDRIRGEPLETSSGLQFLGDDYAVEEPKTDGRPTPSTWRPQETRVFPLELLRSVTALA